ncbi:transposase domain-containing protein [Bacillus sp. NPDC094106]|uniref:transposase domain-containing protein n=1 Tax=Bacillus sp. NPDC094106 TaxID=3363949 RepID=UPI003818CAE3
MEALKREYKEELDVEINIIKLLWVAENFFEYENKKEQGIEFYYLIEVSTNTSIYEQRSFEGYEHESNSVLKFRWFKIDNNRNECSIKPFVIGRKNWMFSNTPRGARGSAIMYSVVETAKENGLSPFHYLRYLFETLPNIDVNNKEEIDKVLPWSTDLPSRCRVPKKSEANKK